MTMLGNKAGQLRCIRVCQQAERTPGIATIKRPVTILIKAAGAPKGVSATHRTVTRNESSVASTS